MNFSYSAFVTGVNQRSISAWIYNIKNQIDVHSLNNAQVIFSSSQDLSNYSLIKTTHIYIKSPCQPTTDYNVTTDNIAVYFDQCIIGAAHSKCWSKYPFPCFCTFSQGFLFHFKRDLLSNSMIPKHLLRIDRT